MKKITLLFLALFTFSLGFSQTFTDTGGPYDMQNGNGTTAATCGTADELTLPLAVTGVGVLGTTNVLESVTFNATHTWNADIQVELQDPSGGTTVLLIQNIGGSGDGFVDCIMQDGAGTPLPTAATTPVTGTFDPLNPLSAFTGVDADGTWNLLVCDDAGGDVGTVDSWSLTFAPAPTCVPAVFSLSQGTNNCPADEFFIDVDITGLGTASTVNILNDGGAPAINGIDGSASPYSVGPFSAGTDVTITVEDAADGTCNDTDNLTTLESCPPDCATAPITPADGATGLSAVAPITFSWTAPASGPTPDSYDFYIGFMSDGSDQAFFANTTDTFYDVAFGEYGLTVYWSIVPKVGAVDALGPCALWSATSETPSGDACLTAPSGQFPGATYDVAASATCDGTTQNNITTNAWAGEYSLVTVVAGENYIFGGSVPTDFITIASEDGLTAYIGGLDSVTWTSTVTGNVRFYTHTDDQCGNENTARTRYVVCGVTLSTEDFNANDDLFSYYPNPVTNTLTLNAQKDIQNVVVYNMLGQQVMRTAPNTVNSEVDMTTLNPGAYFVQVTVENVTETIRIIKN
ncbi:T9SS type A sorting domain-containing protein [Hanstruepera flava]|uniref:T9SS type A sorting domain-containing protein n=1 Tax=Hanstruepera flava TaxID=2930218 RepID=UPI0020276EA7|nr:T9SS type A sorting domain-containing protein [Hanstruepera flava]